MDYDRAHGALRFTQDEIGLVDLPATVVEARASELLTSVQALESATAERMHEIGMDPIHAHRDLRANDQRRLDVLRQLRSQLTEVVACDSVLSGSGAHSVPSSYIH